MTSIARQLDDPLDDRDEEAAVELVAVLLQEARESAHDTEWVVDMQSRRVVRKRVRRPSAD